MLTRRSFSVLAATLVGVFLLVTAASAHIIWEGYEPEVPVSNPNLAYSVKPGNTVNYARYFPVTITKPTWIGVTGPATITLPANQSQVTVTYTFSGAHVGDTLRMSHGDANNTWITDPYFVP